MKELAQEVQLLPLLDLLEHLALDQVLVPQLVLPLLHLVNKLFSQHSLTLIAMMMIHLLHKKPLQQVQLHLHHRQLHHLRHQLHHLRHLQHHLNLPQVLLLLLPQRLRLHHHHQTLQVQVRDHQTLQDKPVIEIISRNQIYKKVLNCDFIILLNIKFNHNSYNAIKILINFLFFR